MGRIAYYQYYVEGQCEEKLLKMLKTDLQTVIPGKVQVFNAVKDEFTNAQLMTLRPKTAVILIFDMDMVNKEAFKTNMDKLKRCKSVADIITIPQVPNFEGEMVRALGLRSVADLYRLFKSQGSDEFKGEFIKANGLKEKLLKNGFSCSDLWKGKTKSDEIKVDNQRDYVFLRER